MRRTTKMALASHWDEDDKMRGRYHDDQITNGDMWIDDKFRDRRGRDHYNNGRYAKTQNYENDLDVNNYPGMRKYTVETYDYVNRPIRDEHIERPMATIGFRDDMNDRIEYPDHDESMYRTANVQRGYSEGAGYVPFDQNVADDWMRRIKNADGTTGAHWTYDQAESLMNSMGMDLDPYEFWVALNLVYSDYCKVAKRIGCHKTDFYAEMARAFLDDEDSKNDKLGRYYSAVVR